MDFFIFRQLATGHSKFFCFLFNSVYYYWLALLRAGEKLISEKWPLQLVSVSSGKIASILTSEPRENPSGTNQAFHQPHSKENRLTNRAGLRPRCLETGRKVESFSGLFMRNKKRSGTKKRACECDKRGRLFKSQGGNKPIWHIRMWNVWLIDDVTLSVVLYQFCAQSGFKQNPPAAMWSAMKKKLSLLS